MSPGTPTNTNFDHAIPQCLRNDKAQMTEIDGEKWFLIPFNPPLKLLLIGAVHIAQVLAPMAKLCGYDLTIIDPRGSFAQRERFEGQTLINTWPDDAMASLNIDARTAIVTLTHDPKIDDTALQLALKSEAFYIGCLGSEKTHGARIERLSKQGFNAETLARINGPVGLDIGATNPAEIAVAILAEITQSLRTER